MQILVLLYLFFVDIRTFLLSVRLSYIRRRRAGERHLPSGGTTTYGDSQWKDKLTAVNGQAITYDACGNPTVYHNGTNLTYEMSWTDGRQLSFFECYNAKQSMATYTYDANGIRTGKEVAEPGYIWNYYYVTQNGKVVRETKKFRDSSIRVADFIYDESGRPFALKYSTDGGSAFTTYYYVLNLQGDVIKLIEADGTVVAEYSYDAWGNVLTLTGPMAYSNPLRYRGYYYDEETGFYYLQSRYYDPATHRFINADSIASTGQGFTGTNMFAYCGNNPIKYVDETGNFAITIGIILEGLIDTVIVCGALMLGYEVLSETQSISKTAISKTKKREEDICITAEMIDETKKSSVFNGCKKMGDALLPLTPDMTFEEAYAWAVSSDRMMDFGKGANWGLYTSDKTDAYIMAFLLGTNAEPRHDTATKSGYYDHYHTFGRSHLADLF